MKEWKIVRPTRPKSSAKERVLLPRSELHLTGENKIGSTEKGLPSERNRDSGSRSIELPHLDFTCPSQVVRAVAEGERLTFGYLFNPAFAAEISLIDTLPHQRIAVYDHMLRETRLRFLLADDAGA